MNRAILLDRDSTIIRGREYLSDPDEVELERGVARALRRLHDAGYLLVIVTNQSGIGRGLYTEAAFRAVQDRLIGLLAEHGIPVAGEYFCPHHPTEARGEFRRVCACRKPAPGMVLSALSDLDLDPAQSFMIGDALSDVAAGQRAGLRGVLVCTGELTRADLADRNGGARAESSEGPDGEAVVPDHVADDMLRAVEDYILAPDAPDPR